MSTDKQYFLLGILVTSLAVVTYMETTKPVLDFYSKNSNFHELDGTLEIDEITRKIDTFINV